VDITFTPEQRARIAAKTGVNPAYLYQCLTGRRDMNPARALEIERQTRGEVRRWHLCQKTWYGIWPDIAKHKGAPAVPVEV
jgi:DNA-binding transcriptional regulator YdaS (Cro superfamily)